MSTSQQFTAPDNTSFATFSAWAKPISDFLASIGWVQQSDTGQAVWVATVLTMTQVAVTGGNSVYSYASFTGPTPRVGMSIIITGFATGGNNVTATLTAVSGGASGTVTVATSTQVNETHAGSGTTTASTLPGTSAYIYEIWAPGDALQTGGTAYYFRIDYGTGGSANVPSFKVNLGTSTNGAGTLSGITLTSITSGTVGQSTTQFECDFSGDTGRLDFILWRTHTTGTSRFLFAIERTLNVDGTPSSDGVTIFYGNSGSNATKQQTLLFGIGAATQYSRTPFIINGQSTSSTDPLNNNTPISPVFPCYGKFGNPQTVFAAINGGDIGDGCLFTTTLYGSTRTYMASLNAMFQNATAVAFRYD